MVMDVNLKQKYALCEAAKKCLENTSVEKLTVKQITEAAGVSRQTFYRMFLDKYDLINWYFDILMSKSFDRMGEGKTVEEGLTLKFRYLKEELAPRISIHGVLVDVFGEGVLLIGESGIGKSEAALELIRRGHRLVTDDVVEIRKINEHTLIGTSPEVTRHFIELRGIGIIDVKTLYGVECVKEKQQIDLVIKLEDWKKDADYDRLGLEEEYIEYLGNKVVCHSLPIRPGRNLAVICETAAVNHRQKKMGYNAAQELYRRVQANMTKSNDEE